MENDATVAQADLSNWRQSPQNRTAFHDLPNEIATARIIGGTKAIADFAISVGRIDAFSLQVPSGSALTLEQALDATSTDAMVVLRDGQLVFETYRNGMRSDTRHIAMSATKAMIGLLTEILASEGVIDMDAPVTTYVPEIQSSPFADAKIRHLLDMRVAVALDEAQEKTYAQAVGWEPLRDWRHGMQTFFSELRGPAWSCGGPFRYHSANTDLLGWAIERATSMKVQDLLSKRLWTRVAADDAAITLDCSGFARSAGGLCSTTRDLARMGHLVSLGGSTGSRQVFPAYIVEGLLKDGDRQAWTAGQWGEAFVAISRKMSYRSGWYTIDGDTQILFAMGVHGQNVFIDRTNNIVAAKFSSWPQAVDGRSMWLTHSMFDEIRRCLV